MEDFLPPPPPPAPNRRRYSGPPPGALLPERGTSPPPAEPEEESPEEEEVAEAEDAEGAAPLTGEEGSEVPEPPAPESAPVGEPEEEEIAPEAETSEPEPADVAPDAADPGSLEAIPTDDAAADEEAAESGPDNAEIPEPSPEAETPTGPEGAANPTLPSSLEEVEEPSTIESPPSDEAAPEVPEATGATETPAADVATSAPAPEPLAGAAEPPGAGPGTSEIEAAPAPSGRTWETGDPLRASAPLTFAAERLVEALDLRFGQRVLDVGSGTGNAALAAARRGARVVGLDPTFGALHAARARAWSEGLRIRWVAGRAEALPFKDRSFAVTISTFGAMFADDPEMAAEELLRVTAEGGAVGLASWTSEGLIGRIYAAAATEEDTANGLSPMIWGSRDQLSRWFGSSAGQMSTAQRTVKLRGPSPERFAEYLSKTLGPVVRGMEARDEAGRQQLAATIGELCEKANRADDGTFLGSAQYLEVIVRLL